MAKISATKIAMSIALLGCLGAGSVLLVFRAALGQEPDTAAVLWTIAQAEFTHADALPISRNPQRLIVRRQLSSYLAKQGWKTHDQLGAMTIYRQDDRELRAICEMFSRYYQICELNKMP